MGAAVESQQPVATGKTRDQHAPARRRRGLLARFRRDDRGVAAVEFAMVALPFFMIVGFIFELGLGYLANKVLQISVDNVARQIRVGAITLSSSATEQEQTDAAQEFRGRICNSYGVEIFFNCDKLLIDVRTIATWADRPEDPDRDETEQTDEDGNTTTILGDIDSSDFGYEIGGRLTINVVRVYYEWTTIMDFNNAQSRTWVDDKRMMTASSAFLNEPF